MELKEPFMISSRLMAAVKVGGATISLGYAERTKEGRMRYGCYIDLPDGREFEVTDLQSGVGGGGIQEGMESLLTFLGAAGESYSNAGMEGEHSRLFPEPVTVWACGYLEEISILEEQLRETKGLVVE